MQPSITTDSLWGELPQKLNAIAEAGFKAYDLRDSDLVTCDLPAVTLAEMARERGLTMSAFLVSVQADVKESVILKALKMLEKLEGEQLVIECSQLPDNASLNLLAQYAARYDSKIAILPLIDSLPGQHEEQQLMTRLQSLSEPLVGMGLDASLALTVGAQPARLRDLDGNQLFYLRLSDRDESGDRRRLPGQGSLNLLGLTRLLYGNGFRGQASVAFDPGSMSHTEPAVMAVDARLAIINLLDDVRSRVLGVQFDIPELPARVYPRGIEFIEFTVDGETYEQLAALLASLCFRLERRHVSKSVELWRQGAINIVVNQDKHGYARRNFERQGPSVCDICLRVDDADQTVARAMALGARVHHESVSEGELQIPAIRGLDGNLLHFIDQKSNLHHNWDIDFTTVSRTHAVQPAGLRRIDHIAQVMPLEQMQSWLLRYLATFELKSQPGQTVSDPAGPVRCRSVFSREGELQLSLNGVQSHGTYASEFLDRHLGNAGVQHIALLTDDILETSKRLSQTGFRRLPIPANYYEDLQLRLALDEELIAALQAGDILYDRDDDGEFYHLYSDSVFGGFFFEVVQRCGRYAGYGARNAPIRLGAQQRRIRLTEQ